MCDTEGEKPGRPLCFPGFVFFQQGVWRLETIRPVLPEHEAIAESLASEGVEYVFASFIDVAGRAKSKCVPVHLLPELLAGHERYTPRGLGGLGVMTPNEDECVTIPDLSTLTVLPFAPQFAHMVADLHFGGAE